MADNHPIDLDIEGLEDPVEIGVGGFATVYKAFQPAFRRTVAVKVLANLNLDAASRERFERECQAMGSLSEHPNIVTVYGAGFTNSGRPYLVMAYLPGGSLQSRLEREGQVPWQDGTLYGVHLAGALETAHRAQIVHRDIKPGNVLMSSFGDAQLTDFGIARISGGHETRSGVITASMAHAPPEILDGQRPTIAADIYSLGSTIYELMLGRPAFEVEGDESMVPMLRRILTDPPPDLRPLGVPDALCTVLERSMAKDPTHRQASALQFGRELQSARRSLGLDPGKLTVPSDVSLDIDEGQAIDFVAAVPPTGLTTQAPAAPPSPAAAAGTSPFAGAAPAAAPGQTAPVANAPVAAPVGAMPGYGVPPGGAPVEKKRSAGLVVGVGVLVVLLLLVLGFVAIKAAGKSEIASSDTTTTTVTTALGDSTTSITETTTTATIEPTTTTEPESYTPEIESRFVESCARNPGSTRIFCRCVFKGVKEQIPFAEFLKLEETVQNGGSLEGTTFQQIAIDCRDKTSLPASGN